MVTLLANSVYGGLALGSIYALAGLAFALVYYTTGLFHIAAGGIGVFGAFVVVNIADLMAGGGGFAAGMLVAAVLSIVLSVGVYFIVYRPLAVRLSDRTIVFVASLGIEKIVESVVTLIFGSKNFSFDMLDWLTFHPVLGLQVSLFTVLAIIVGALTLVTLLFMLQRTAWGYRVRAVASNRELAELIGVRTDVTIATTFVGCSLVMLVASVLYGMTSIVQLPSGMNLVLMASLATLIGGHLSYVGTYVAGLLLGITQLVVATLVPGEWAVVAVFGLFFLVMLVRPTGLLSTRV